MDSVLNTSNLDQIGFVISDCLRSRSEDDTDAHDDELQDKLAAEFKATFDECIRPLEAEFGSARVVDLLDESADEGMIEQALSLVEGLVRVAFWEASAALLFLAVVHEDREAPIALLIGAV